VTTSSSAKQGDLLAAWLVRDQPPARVRGQRPTPTVGTRRFAFYGRISIAEYQDEASSRRWQYNAAVDVIADHGVIVAEYFDVGCSRSLPWHKRPHARALLAAVADPDPGFDAIVVGEYERAFSAGQLHQLLPTLHRHDIQLWLPEIGGPLDHHDPAHQALIMLLGHQSRREVLRARFRTTAAMRAQARDQGRHLGGRPPYGYHLIDAGSHPNDAHARWGRRLHRLDPDPATATHVQWIFIQRLAGHSTAGIARTLNHLGVPPPSGHDRARNPHRSGHAWTLRAVAAILTNPRYTGRQVWNRQRTDHNETDPGDKRTSHGPVHRWNPRTEWIISTRPAHPALVSDEDFINAQTINAVPIPADGTIRRYQLTGLVICRTCGRRADAHWVHGRPGYRCRHGHTSASPATPGRPKPLYLREDQILARVRPQLPTPTPPDQHDSCAVAQHLRIHQLLIICDANTITISRDPPPANPGRKKPHTQPPHSDFRGG
jgi:hypothetical protein